MLSSSKLLPKLILRILGGTIFEIWSNISISLKVLLFLRMYLIQWFLNFFSKSIIFIRKEIDSIKIITLARKLAKNCNINFQKWFLKYNFKNSKYIKNIEVWSLRTPDLKQHCPISNSQYCFLFTYNGNYLINILQIC